MIERRATVRGIERRALYSARKDVTGAHDVPGCYRYLLEIVWLPLVPSRLQCVCLNPSTADHLQDDPTVYKLRKLAGAMGFGGLLMTNLCAFRATKPGAMLASEDPFGPENTPEWLASLPADLVLAGWGRHATHKRLAERTAEVRAAFGDRLHALRLTRKSRVPEHPLYIPGDLRPRPLSELESA